MFDLYEVNVMNVAGPDEKIELVEVVRWQDGKIHVLGRGVEKVCSDSVTYRAFHVIHDALSGNIISEQSFVCRGHLPLFMCGCYLLSCEGDCPPLLDDELIGEIQRNRAETEKYLKTISTFIAANIKDRAASRFLSA